MDEINFKTTNNVEIIDWYELRDKVINIMYFLMWHLHVNAHYASATQYQGHVCFET